MGDLPRRILVVEDDPGIRQILSLGLTSSGYEVSEAEHGEEAIAVLERERPDAILLDLMMPVMDGWTFRAQQLADERWAGIPVIVMSAVHNLHRGASDLHATAVVSKPFCLPDLLESIDRLFR